MMKSISVTLLYLCLFIVSCCRGEIVELTDATFEHQTQVSLTVPCRRRGTK